MNLVELHLLPKIQNPIIINSDDGKEIFQFDYDGLSFQTTVSDNTCSKVEPVFSSNDRAREVADSFDACAYPLYQKYRLAAINR
jgi:hypothetical protein